jgi:cbb3-type cytochrome oxidase subunit 3
MRQPVFIVAAMSGMFGYGAMTFVMIATPLAMNFCGFAFTDSATVIQWHVLAMFAPSFITGSLIKKFGVLNIILCGVVLNVCAIAINLSGIEFLNFSIGLATIGLGWNFMFIGGTTLLTEAYRPEERSKVQAANDFMVLSTTTIAAFSSGALQQSVGWAMVNAMVTVPMTLVFAAVIWFKFIYLPKQAYK